MQENEKIQLFENAPIPRAVAKLAVPMIFSSLVMVLYNMADTYFVGMMNDPVENAAVSTYKKDTSVKATLTVEVVKPKFAFQAIVGEGKGSILYGGEEMPNGYYGEHKAGEQIALKAVADSGYEFVGWAEEEGATEAVYEAGQLGRVPAGTTLYAVWQPL